MEVEIKVSVTTLREAEEAQSKAHDLCFSYPEGSAGRKLWETIYAELFSAYEVMWEMSEHYERSEQSEPDLIERHGYAVCGERVIID